MHWSGLDPGRAESVIACKNFTSFKLGVFHLIDRQRFSFLVTYMGNWKRKIKIESSSIDLDKTLFRNRLN